jgi:hypothetical protein
MALEYLRLAFQLFTTYIQKKQLEKHPIKIILFELDLYQILINVQLFFNRKSYCNSNLHVKLHNVQDFLILFNHLDEVWFLLK